MNKEVLLKQIGLDLKMFEDYLKSVKQKKSPTNKKQAK